MSYRICQGAQKRVQITSKRVCQTISFNYIIALWSNLPGTQFRYHLTKYHRHMAVVNKNVIMTVIIWFLFTIRNFITLCRNMLEKTKKAVLPPENYNQCVINDLQFFILILWLRKQLGFFVIFFKAVTLESFCWFNMLHLVFNIGYPKVPHWMNLYIQFVLR